MIFRKKMKKPLATNRSCVNTGCESVPVTQANNGFTNGNPVVFEAAQKGKGIPRQHAEVGMRILGLSYDQLNLREE